MVRISVPTILRGGAFATVRTVWTAPTTLVGHGLARLAGCGPPERVGGNASRAWLYRLPPGRFRGLGAITIGHAIVAEPGLLARHGRWLVAHELAHTRQHNWLGPVYLPAHALFQLLSALIYLARPVARYSPVHAYNPLERTFICVPFDAIAEPQPPSGELAERVLDAFGLSMLRNIEPER